MLFPVKRLPSMNSADQYLVSSLQATEVSASSSYPLLLKYHNLGDGTYFNNPTNVETQDQSNTACDDSQSNQIYLNAHGNQFDDCSDSSMEESNSQNFYSRLGLVGLHNLENTCFMNSIIQCLRFTKPLFQYITTKGYIKDFKGDNPDLVEEFANLVQCLWNSDSIKKRAISPRLFANAVQQFSPEFNGRTQEDAHEFLICILTGLHENLNTATQKTSKKLSSVDALQGQVVWQNYIKANNSRIIDIFFGQLLSTLICSYCCNQSATFEPFFDLSLPIPSCPDGVTPIEHCLKAYLNSERIDGSNMPYCSKCKSHQAYTKQMSIHRLPRVLILHLKRFTENQEKLNTLVQFPVRNLDLGTFCSADAVSGVALYSLYAVVNHRGSLTYGHYTAFCSRFLGNDWFEFNDDLVIPVESAESMITDKAYILFYELSGQSSKL